MDSRYSRNRIYIKDQEQEYIKNYPILLGGSGIGSVIAECALRLGFENITIVDGDQVELSNLNRQNYIEEDVAISKTAAISKRLLSINPKANITVLDCFITEDNIETIIEGHEIAINALDFTTEIPLLFDEICQKKGISVLHPYNLGWGALVAVITPKSLSLNSIAKEGEKFNEVKMVEYATSYMKFWGKPQKWIEDIIDDYKNEKEILPPPQLSIASWLVASVCTHILFNIATGKDVKEFPEFYLSTINN
ncbi:ThiF family adenylyltransferase [Tenacibaculum ovolyticum]|uniref:ThiF family adenylyltransferase n=1 Tax=Tenacibaculum ovolyticum TaxID=104270 RepID=UPI0022F3D452|nr:ThiF family adenylyltransferase [Tenacibaculum ovolyticum]WBX76116.1 ThiF family adenylyltransferase [Tenacibaculum ovolyticum]